MKSTPWKVLFKPTKNKEALILSHFEAIDISYNCPTCGGERATVWLFPDTVMVYKDECHNNTVVFKPKEAEEE